VPWVAAETKDFLVVYKPPLMHSAPLRGGASLLDWCAGLYPEVLSSRGRLEREGGLLHRLDYGTWGLVLLARTQAALESLEQQQQQGSFLKEYGLLTDAAPQPLLPGFPPAPPPAGPSETHPPAVASGFRPYGPGRKAVRPVLPGGPSKKRIQIALDRGGPYKTEILERQTAGNRLYFRVRIARAFRHQIRCHFSWLGHPVLGDGLYGRYGGDGRPGQYGRPGRDGEQPLMLKAQALSFLDPFSGETRRYQLPPILEDEGTLIASTSAQRTARCVR
jgi:23S rRNA-/tRNA-specific pseudouridylate synthase